MSEQIVSAPFSLTGSAQRIWRKFNPLLAVPFIAIAWTFIVSWYLIFGIFLVPYRLVRRSQRKAKLEQQRHQELLVRYASPEFWNAPTVNQ